MSVASVGWYPTAEGMRPEQGRNLGAGLGETENVVDEEEHVLAHFIAEILGHGQAGKRHAHTSSGRFVHLAEDERRARLRGIAVLGLPSLAVTIGTLALFRGLALVIIGDNAVANFPKALTAFFTSKIGGTGIPTVMIGVVVVIVFFGVLLHFTPFGRGLYAMGYSKEAASFVGINVARSKFWLYVASGAVSALAGIFWTLRYTSARSDNASGLELAVIAAVLLGGVSIFGGKGSIPASSPASC